MTYIIATQYYSQKLAFRELLIMHALEYLTFHILLFACSVIVHAFVVICRFSKITVLKEKSLKRLDLYQDWHSVGPDLGQNCLQRLSEDNRSRR